MQGVRSSPSKPCVVPAPGFATLVCPICPSPPAFAWQELPSASNHTKGHKSKYKVSIAESTIRTCRRIKCNVSNCKRHIQRTMKKLILNAKLRIDTSLGAALFH
jgi:hypothetical protein